MSIICKIFFISFNVAISTFFSFSSFAEEISYSKVTAIKSNGKSSKTTFQLGVVGLASSSQITTSDSSNLGSCIFMKENALFTNKVIGWTDEVQNSIGINPDTLLEDGSGLHLKSAHVQHSLRKYFGIDKTNLNNIYPITSEEDSVYLFT